MTNEMIEGSVACEPSVIENPTSIDDIPRYEEPNPYNYTALQKEVREKELDKFEVKYPNIPTKWIEWVFDMINNRPIEETRAIINSGELEKPPEIPYSLGGNVENAVQIEDASGNIITPATSTIKDDKFKDGEDTTTYKVEVTQDGLKIVDN